MHPQMEKRPAEYLDLENDLDSLLPSDGKDYLAQLGIEEYLLESPERTNPGKYYDNVPLEDNPEAYLDLLSRESLRRKGKYDRAGGHVTAPKKTPEASQNKAKPGGRRLLHSLSAPSVESSRESTSSQEPEPSTSTPTNGASKCSTPKRVSFNEQLSEEIPPPAEGAKGTSGGHKKKWKIKTLQHLQRQACPIGCFAMNSDYATYATTSAIIQRRNNAENALPNGTTSRGDTDSSADTNPKKGKKFKFLGVRTKKEPQEVTPEEPPTEVTPLTADIEPEGSPKVTSVNTHVRSESLDSSPSRSTNSSSPSIDMIDNVAYSNSALLKNAKNTLNQTALANSRTTASINFAEETVVANRTESDSQPASRRTNVVEIISNERSPRSNKKDISRTKDLYPFLQAACNGDVPALRTELEHLTEEEVLHLVDDCNNTALHLAASCGQQQCVEVLAKRCPRLLSAENKIRLTPVGLAIKHGQIECLDWLLENLDIEDQLYATGKRSLLHFASKFGQDGCLRLLLSKCSSKKEKDSSVDANGNTPAHLAAKHGHMTCLQSLVEFNADVHSSNHAGQTPCSTAQAYSHEDCARYLLLVDTARRLAQDIVSRDRHIERLQHESEDFQKHLKDCLDVNVALLKQLQVDQTRERHIRGLLEDCGDLLWDSMEQMQAIFTENCVLKQRYVGEQDNRELRRDILGKIERTKLLRRHLKKLDKSVEQPALRQYWLKVKDMERELAVAHNQDDATESDLESQVNHVLNEQISEIFSGHSILPPGGTVTFNQSSQKSEGGISAITKLASVEKYLQNNDLGSSDNANSSEHSEMASSSKEPRYYENIIIRNDIPPIDLSFLNHNLSEDDSTVIYENGIDEKTEERVPDSRPETSGALQESTRHTENTREREGKVYPKETRGNYRKNYSSHVVPAAMGKSRAFKEGASRKVGGSLSPREGRNITPEITEIQTDTEMNPDDLDQIESVSQNGDTPTMPSDLWASSNYRPPDYANGSYPPAAGPHIRPIKLDLTYVDFKETYARDKVKDAVKEDDDEEEEDDDDDDSYDGWAEDKRSRNTGPVVENFHSWVKQEVHKFDAPGFAMERAKGHEGGDGRREGRYDDEDLFDEDEEILVDPSLRIVPSMQFDMNLSTIEEASVVSGSTRTDDEPREQRPDPITSLAARQSELAERKSPEGKKLSKSDKPWYELSDDEESLPSWKRKNIALQNNEHFTLL